MRTIWAEFVNRHYKAAVVNLEEKAHDGASSALENYRRGSREPADIESDLALGMPRAKPGAGLDPYLQNIGFSFSPDVTFGRSATNLKLRSRNWLVERAADESQE